MRIEDDFDAHLRVVEAARSVIPELRSAAEVIAAALAAGGTCFALGNGGSAADAQHFAAELVGDFAGPGAPLSALALTCDGAVLTSIANDRSYDEVFARQLAALARPGDVVVAISTSGRSRNVVRAAEAATSAGCAVIGLTAGGGGELAAHCDVVVDIPSTDTQRTQEAHELCLHSIVADVRRRLR